MAFALFLRRYLGKQMGGERLQTFVQRIIPYLDAYNEYQAVPEDWMITSYEVEFGHRIGVGGLFVFDDYARVHMFLFPGPFSFPAVKYTRGFGTTCQLL